MSVTEQINLLIQLQKLDSEIYGLNRRKEDMPLVIKNLDENFKKKSETLKQHEDALKGFIVKQKGKENELAAKEETIKKCQTQLYQIKTNKEYAAMQHEIEGYKADKSVLEDGIIAVLDEVEAEKKEIDKEKTVLKEEEKNLSAEKDKFSSELKDIEARLKTLAKERSELAGKVDKAMLSKYERVLKGKDGLAMVAVRDNACSGCRLNMPPQVINEIMMKKDLVFCESCSRVLYIEE